MVLSIAWCEHGHIAPAYSGRTTEVDRSGASSAGLRDVKRDAYEQRVHA